MHDHENPLSGSVPEHEEGGVEKGVRDFEVAQDEVVQWLREDLEEVSTRECEIDELNDELGAAVEALPDHLREQYDTKLAELRAEITEIKDRYRTKVTAFAKVVLLAGAPIVLSGPDSGIETGHMEQIESVDFKEMVIDARQELQESGTTDERSGAYTPVVSKALFEGIDSYYYDQYLTKIRDFIPNLIIGRDKRHDDIEDAWRMYLGIPQENGTFGVSEYQPAVSTEVKYYYTVDGFFENQAAKKYGGDGVAMVTDIIEKVGEGTRFNDSLNQVMGNYTVGLGEDEKGSYVSYYDRWDLDAVGAEGESGTFGKPYEIYDRLYYDPETLEPQLDQEKMQNIMEEWSASWRVNE